MTSTISSVILVLSVAATAFAATAYGPAETQPDRPGECWDQATNLFYKPGNSWTKEGCLEASCLELNATGVPKLFVTYQTCGKMAVEAPCYLVEDKTQSYPDCCPEIVCPDSAEEEEDVGTTKAEEEAQVKQTPTTQMVDVAGRTSTSDVSTSTTAVPATSEEPTKDSRSDFDEFNNWDHDHDSHFRDDSENEVPSSGGAGDSTYRLFDIFRKTFAWDDYSYNDVMDNNVDDTRYGNSPDYYHYGKRLSTGFTEDDFDIKGFKWF